MDKYWNTTQQHAYPTLTHDIECDVAIIGGGLAGVMTAWTLSNAGYSVCIFESNAICSGESANSSAMVTFAHDVIYQQLVKKQGHRVATEYLHLNQEGLRTITTIAKGLDCDCKQCDFTLFATTSKGLDVIDEERLAYGQLGLALTQTAECELPFPVTKTLNVPDQYQLNPYKFVTQLAHQLSENGVKIFENSPAHEGIHEGKLDINNHVVTAKHFVIATHFPYLDFPGHYFAKMYQSRSHNAIYKTTTILQHMYESAEEDGYEYRSTPDGILCGGCSARCGKMKVGNCYNTLDEHLYKAFQCESNCAIAHFSAQDCITFDSLPFVGRYSKKTPNTYVVTGFNKWGFTTSAVAAKIILRLINNESFVNIFDPNRMYGIKSPVKELRNIACDLHGFIARLGYYCGDLSTLQVGEGKLMTIGGKRLGVYRNHDGSIDAVNAVCQHLGCALQWNNTDKTWDCPCHGSRYDTKGNILSNPTTKYLNSKSLTNNNVDNDKNTSESR